MQLARIEGLPPEVKPVALSASLVRHVVGIEPLGSTSNLHPAGDGLTLQEAEADPRIVPHVSPPEPPSDGERAEAMRKIGAAEKLCRPVDPRLMAFWCARLKPLPFAPQGDMLVDAAIGAMCLACAEIPNSVVTNETLALALRTFRRWPAPADVWLLLSGQAKPFLRIRDGLRRVLASAPDKPVEATEPPTPEALQHVRSVVAAFTAERRTYQPSQSLPAQGTQPRSLSLGRLLAAYETLAAQGDTAAAIRVAMLRRQLHPEDRADG